MNNINEKKTPIALTIAGSDSCGGAGIQADIKTFSANGVYGASVITSLTAQNTIRVKAIHSVNTNFIEDQIETVFEDLDIQAVKIGMLENVGVIECVAKSLKKVKAKNIVLDPVMVAKSGDKLLKDDAIESLKTLLIPLTDIITPNIPESAHLLSKRESNVINSMSENVIELYKLGAKSVLLKGGHLKSKTSDDLFYDGKIFETFSSERYRTKKYTWDRLYPFVCDC